MRGGRTYWQRGVAAVMLLPVMVVAASFAHDLIRCRLTGVIVAGCACADAAENGEETPAPTPASAPEATGQGCCERQSVEAIAVGREEAGGSHMGFPSRSPATRSIALHEEGASAPGRRCSSWSSIWALTLRPPRGASLVLLKRSFLI